MPKGVPKDKPPVEIVTVLGRKMSVRKRDCIVEKRQEGMTDEAAIAKACGCYKEDVLAVFGLLTKGENYLRGKSKED